MFRHTDLNRDAEVLQCFVNQRIPINPYKMRDGRGVDFTLRARDLLGTTYDPGSWMGCMYVNVNRDTHPDDIKVILDLRDEEYRLYEAVLANQ